MKVMLVAPMGLPGGPVGGMGSVTENMIHFLGNHPSGIDLIHYNTVHRIRSLSTRSLWYRIFTGIMNSLDTYVKVFMLIKRNKPDIIHLASSSSFALLKDFLIVKTANRSDIPIVMHWHFGRAPSLAMKRNWEWRILNNVVRNSTLSIVIDKKTQYAFNKEGLSNVVYIPNPLSTDVVIKAKESYPRPGQRQNNRLIYVGHVIKNKGVYELVMACSQIPVNIELMLIGSYTEDVKNELTEIAHRKNEGNWLHFSGQLKKDQVLEHMLASPVLILPSYTEGFPMVIIEAMAMGCAIIATDVGAIPEILDIAGDTPCGICIPPQNVEKLKEAILKLEKDPLMRDAMGKRGNERALNHYNAENVINEYIKIWEALAIKTSMLLTKKVHHNNAYQT